MHFVSVKRVFFKTCWFIVICVIGVVITYVTGNNDYAVSYDDVIENDDNSVEYSEKIVVQRRDRNNFSRILSSQSLNRGADLSLEETIGSSVPQSIFNSGSFHRILPSESLL